MRTSLACSRSGIAWDAQQTRNFADTSSRSKLPMIPHRPLTAAPRALQKTGLHLLGVSLSGDLHERATDCGVTLPLSRQRVQRIQCIEAARIMFIHVPKCAGMAVCEALYGTQLKHGTIRWYRQYAPHLDDIPSFAILRDPVARFVSAYRYATAGGSKENRVSEPFNQQYQAWRCIDEALDHVESVRSIYRLDHIFRPQQWYITDRNGAVDVDVLFSVDDPALSRFIQMLGGRALRHVNRSTAAAPQLSSGQEERIPKLYQADVVLHAAVLKDEARAASSHGLLARLVDLSKVPANSGRA